MNESILWLVSLVVLTFIWLGIGFVLLLNYINEIKLSKRQLTVVRRLFYASWAAVMLVTFAPRVLTWFQ